MSPRKDPKLAWLPPRVYLGKSGYEYHPKGGGSKTIASKKATKHEVLEAYLFHAKKGGAFSRLWEKYKESDGWQRLAESTRKDYLGAWAKLEPVFGHVAPRTVKAHHIRTYMDKRTSKKRANVERILLRNIFNWAIEYNHVDENPCDRVRPYPMKARERYVTDAEYQEVYDKAPDVLKVFMELSYICAARGQDVRTLRVQGDVEKDVSGIVEEGLYIRQGKTGKKQIKLWNNRLRAAVNMAKRVRGEKLAKSGVASMYLIPASSGKCYTAGGLKSLWRDYKTDFTFHDLKAKGISDFEGDKQGFSGHADRRQMERYNRTPDKTSVIDFKDKS